MTVKIKHNKAHVLYKALEYEDWIEEEMIDYQEVT